MIPPNGEQIEQERGSDVDVLVRRIESCRTYLLFVAGKLQSGLIRERESPSDLVQQAMLSAIATILDGRARLPGDDVKEVRAWLRRILINTHRDSLRHHYAQQRSPDREHPDAAIDVAADTPSPSSRAGRNEEAERVAKARLALDDRERQLLCWWFDDELSFTEIAERLGCSVSGARKACLRAGERLKAAYELKGTRP